MKETDNPLDLERMRSLYASVADKRAFSRDTGITTSMINYILNGQSSPSAKKLAAFAAYFNVPTGMLFSDYGKYHDDETHAVNKSRYRHALILKEAAIYYNE